MTITQTSKTGQPKYSKNPEIQARIEWAQSEGMTVLPVAPEQDPHHYPLKRNGQIIYEDDGVTRKKRFTGKNPSYIDARGVPKTVKHSAYKNKKPTDKELKEWFADPSVGIGVLAGSGGVTWIDIDRKNFKTQKDCDNALAQILEYCDLTYYERTRSGGHHIAIELEKEKDFTNFKLGKDGHHVGEFLGDGRFCVLAPTPGYKALNGTEIAVVESAESLGIYPVKSDSPATEKPTPTQSSKWAGKITELQKLITKKHQAILNGVTPTTKDRSATLTAFIKDILGWINFCNARGVALNGVDSVFAEAAETLGASDKLDRILKKINASTCKPALEKAKGVEACEKHLDWAINPPKREDYVSNDEIVIKDDDQPGLVVYREICEGRDYISINDEVYKFTGTHYELVDSSKLRHEIAKLLERCVKVDATERGIKVSRPYATSKSLTCALKYVTALIPAIAPDEVGRAGINCINGVLTLGWEDGQLVTELVPHDPSMVFLGEPKVTYDPNADDTHFNNLMQAVEPEYHSIVLRVLASTFDLQTTRNRLHRGVRILTFLGDGSNGKDALKVGMSAILGNRGLTSVPLSAFQQYDQGRQFGIAALASSRLNWPSENSFHSTLDSIECIKSCVTGEPLQYERKNKDAVEFTPATTLVFNGNADTLKIIAGSEAIRSRYAIVPFKKTFKNNPDPNDPNELQADPRFKNPQWVAENVGPAMLNVLLKELNNLANEGIDYSPVEAIMDEHTRASFHLAEFLEDVGLVPAKGHKVPINDIWSQLIKWYQNEDYVEVAFNNDITFGADPRPGDKLIRHKNQLSSALVKFLNGAANKGAGTKSNGIRYLVNVAWKGDLEPIPEPIGDNKIDPEDSLDEPEENITDDELAAMVADCRSKDEFETLMATYLEDYPTKEDRRRVWELVPIADQQRIAKYFEDTTNEPETT